MVYQHACATTPVCAPARATLITGMYATSIGAMHMRTGQPSAAALARDPEAYAEIPSYEATPPPEVRCFPELLRWNGYFCTNNSKKDYQFAAPVTVWDESSGKAHWFADRIVFLFEPGSAARFYDHSYRSFARYRRGQNRDCDTLPPRP